MWRGASDVPVSVGVVGGDVEEGLLAGLHGDDALVPALDDAADANVGLEVAAADRGVESAEDAGQPLLSVLVAGRALWLPCSTRAWNDGSGESIPARKRGGEGRHVLAALVVGLGGVLEEAGVLNGDVIADLWAWAAALAEDGLGESHDCWCFGKASGGGESGGGGVDETGKTAGEGGEHCKRGAAATEG